MIVFYDDQPFWIDDYVKELTRQSFSVEIYVNARKLINDIITKVIEPDLYIIDLMVFGKGNEFSGIDTEDGLRSGNVLLDELTKYENQKIIQVKPKIVLTNRKGDAFYEISNDKRVYSTLYKVDYMPEDLVIVVRNALNKK